MLYPGVGSHRDPRQVAFHAFRRVFQLLASVPFTVRLSLSSPSDTPHLPSAFRLAVTGSLAGVLGHARALDATANALHHRPPAPIRPDALQAMRTVREHACLPGKSFSVPFIPHSTRGTPHRTGPCPDDPVTFQTSSSLSAGDRTRLRPSRLFTPMITDQFSNYLRKRQKNGGRPLCRMGNAWAAKRRLVGPSHPRG